MQRSHTHNLLVKMYQETHISLSADTSATMPNLSAVVDQPDILEINDAIDDETSEDINWW